MNDVQGVTLHCIAEQLIVCVCMVSLVLLLLLLLLLLLYFGIHVTQSILFSLLFDPE